MTNQSKDDIKSAWKEIYQYLEDAERTHYAESGYPKNHIMRKADKFEKLLGSL